jgi:hypothetical protein
MDIKWFAIKDAVFQSRIDPRCIDTKNNVADEYANRLDTLNLRRLDKEVAIFANKFSP